MKTSEFLNRVSFFYTPDVFKFVQYTSIEGANKALKNVRCLKGKLSLALQNVKVLYEFDLCVDKGYWFSLSIKYNTVSFSFDFDEVMKSIPVLTDGSADVSQAQLERWTKMDMRETFKYALEYYIEKLSQLEEKLIKWIEFLESDSIECDDDIENNECNESEDNESEDNENE